jgi:hypothetical protein
LRSAAHLPGTGQGASHLMTPPRVSSIRREGGGLTGMVTTDAPSRMRESSHGEPSTKGASADPTRPDRADRGQVRQSGLPNQLLQLHHIEEWHVYQTHDEAHMVAVCAGCHDSIQRGGLSISDDDLYRWKGVDRSAFPTAHWFVEPGISPRLLAGSVALEGDSGLLVFDFGRHNRLSLALVDNDIVLLNVKLSTYGGEPVLDVVDGYIRQRDEDITLETRPGRVRILGSINNTRFVPDWARTSLLLEDLHYGMSGLPLLDLEVTRPGVVRVRGSLDRRCPGRRDHRGSVEHTQPSTTKADHVHGGRRRTCSALSGTARDCGLRCLALATRPTSPGRGRSPGLISPGVSSNLPPPPKSRALTPDHPYGGSP